jgi:hypothetical protein
MADLSEFDQYKVSSGPDLSEFDQYKAGDTATQEQPKSNAFVDTFNDAKNIVSGVGNVIQHPEMIPLGIHEAVKGISYAAQHPKETFSKENIDKTVGNIKETILHKPLTTVMNASALAGGAGSLIKGSGELAGASKVSSVGQGMVDAANVPFQAGGAIAKGTVKNIKAVGEAIPENLKKSSYGIMQSIVGQLPKEFKYGANAGRAAVKEGFKGNADDILSQTNDRISEIGKQGDNLASSSNKIINNSSAIDVIDKKISELHRISPRTSSSTITKLQNAKKDLLGVVEDGNGNILHQSDVTSMTPFDTLAFKRQVDDMAAFKGTATDDTVFNKTIQDARSKLKNNLNEAVPGMKEWNQRYADLSALKQAAARKVDQLKAGAGMRNVIDNVIRGSVGVTTIGAALTGHGDLVGEILAGWGAKEIIGNPTLKSNVAQMIYKMSELDKAKMFKVAPWIKGQYRNIMNSINNSKPVAQPYTSQREPGQLQAPGQPRTGPRYYNPQESTVNYPISGENPVKGLPDRSIPIGPTTRTGVNPDVLPSSMLPSPRTVSGQGSGAEIIQGTTYKPTVQSPVTTPPKYGTENAYALQYKMQKENAVPLHPAREGKAAADLVYEKATPKERIILDSNPTTEYGKNIKKQIEDKYSVPLHPPREAKAALRDIYPPAEKGNPNIPKDKIDSFNEMMDWQLSQEAGGVKIYGGKQTGAERTKVVSANSNTPLFKKISGNSQSKGFELLQKAANGDKLTSGEKVKIKMLIHEWDTKFKPKM